MQLRTTTLAIVTLLAIGCSNSSGAAGDVTAGTSASGNDGGAGTGGGDAGSGGAGSGGAGSGGGVGMGDSSVLDDPFGVGPRYCDDNSGAGGDACGGFMNSAGFFPDPEHMTTALEADTSFVVAVTTEFTPTTELKVAVEDGVRLRAFGSDTNLVLAKTWSAQGDQSVAITLQPEDALAEGWYSLFVPRAAREILSASYTRYVRNPMFIGGPFVELDGGDLRADFRVGSQPLVTRISASSSELRIVFSENVAADAPPVALAIGNYEPECAPSEWTGAGRTLLLACTTSLLGYGDPITVSVAEGFVADSGEPLRGPNGATAFAIEVPEGQSVELDASDVSE